MTLKKYFGSEKEVGGLSVDTGITPVKQPDASSENPQTTTELGYWDKERKLWVESDIMKSNWESI